MFRANNLPALNVNTGSRRVVLGDGHPQGVLNITPFELTRAATGRRSVGQVRNLDWSVDPSPWMDHIFLMPPRGTALVE